MNTESDIESIVDYYAFNLGPSNREAFLTDLYRWRDEAISSHIHPVQTKHQS